MERATGPDREAEVFARVWRRVSPDPERGPIECDAPAPEEVRPPRRAVPARSPRPAGAGGPELARLCLALAAIFIIHSQTRSKLFTTSPGESGMV